MAEEMKFNSNREVIGYAVDLVRKIGAKWETVSKGLLDKGLIKAPWDNFYHIVKNCPIDKDLMLKVYAIITSVDIRTGRDGVHHAKAKLLGKMVANFAKDGLKDEAAIAKAAAAFAVKVAAPKVEDLKKKVVPKAADKKLAVAAGPDVKKPAPAKKAAKK
jgi:hypothetical protein